MAVITIALLLLRSGRDCCGLTAGPRAYYYLRVYYNGRLGCWLLGALRLLGLCKNAHQGGAGACSWRQPRSAARASSVGGGSDSSRCVGARACQLAHSIHPARRSVCGPPTRLQLLLPEAVLPAIVVEHYP